MRARSLLATVLCAAASASRITWLPLGDSITWGCGNGVLPHEADGGCEADAGAYRMPTSQALEQSNITVTTLGSRSAGPASAPAAWHAHEGHPGWRIDELTAIAGAWTALAPQVVTMLVGANDCLQGDGGALAIARMAVLLNTTAAALPGAKVLVGSMLDVPTSATPVRRAGGRAAFVSSAGAKACQLAFNAALPALIAQVDAGRGDVVYVPVAENTVGVCGDDKSTWSIGDGVHPNAGGHAKVAAVFALWMRRALCPNWRPDASC